MPQQPDPRTVIAEALEFIFRPVSAAKCADTILSALDAKGFQVTSKPGEFARFRYEPSEAEIEAAAIAMFFRNVGEPAADQIDQFRTGDAWPVWIEQAKAALIATARARG